MSTPLRVPTCDRCVFYSESAGPDGFLWCAHSRFHGFVTELEPLCAGEGFTPREGPERAPPR